MSLAKDEQALLLFTNRLLLDWISISIDSGSIAKSTVERLIDFSTQQVVQGAPWLQPELENFATLTKERLPPNGPSNPD
jgi:hypothetical protein